MTDLDQQATEIRQFLLGQLQRERAEQLEERIFTDPDFAEEVEIVESEMIADYRRDTLSPDARALFEGKYLKSAASLQLLEDESVFSEFIHAKRKQREALPKGRLLFTHRSVFAASMIAAGLIFLLAAGIWYLFPGHRPQSSEDDSALQRRRAREAELANLNADPAATAGVKASAAVDLKAIQRGGGGLPRLSISGLNQDDLIKLRLSLAQSGAGLYRVLFLDEQRNELFAIASLTPQNTPDGPQIQVLIPAGYFSPGDYQISLSSLNKDGSFEETNRYAFRVVKPQ